MRQKKESDKRAGGERGVSTSCGAMHCLGRIVYQLSMWQSNYFRGRRREGFAFLVLL